MLKELSIRNFAIIDDLKISFSDGLTILSGETGAGKSIILNAVNLLLGSRASAELVRTGAETAELEALFQISPRSETAKIMSRQGYDPEEGLLIRRIIARSDNNRVYINGQLATIQLLNAITENLASISGQHAHQGLLKEDQHLLILDRFGGLMSLRQEVFDLYHRILPLIDELKELKKIHDRQAERIELLHFQKNEIVDTGIAPEEDTELEQERVRLKNAETLYRIVDGSIEELYGASGSVIERLLEVKKNLERAGQIDSRLNTSADSLADSAYRIEDLIEELRAYLKLLQIDEQRLEAVEERLDTLNKLKRKYGGSLKAVLSKLDAIEQELLNVENISGKITEVKKLIANLHDRSKELSLKLSRGRKKACNILARKIIKALASLKMVQTVFRVELSTIPCNEKTDRYLQFDNHALTETGIDRAIFIIAPNPGEALKPLASIASGGELSRVVLALKAILAETDAVETLIFDEVDAGIGGGTAEVVGRELSALANHHQVICITHLPQIAKFGATHFNISKHVIGGRTQTVILPLNEEGRHKEIARMLGGEEITETTLEHARELLEK
ncbi:MAG: DNA repair protein RecN, partial [Deltaproteobacteria bacterium]|jgi:DNA repair protein RecN (Recombination protein N)|nr:DNA repair protein RecN [Deltaproteobacteria bacterium]